MVIIQYPHIARLQVKSFANQDEPEEMILGCRYEPSTSSRLVNFNGNDIPVKGIVYTPLPVDNIQLTTEIEVYESTKAGVITVYGSTGIITQFKKRQQLQAGINSIDNVLIPSGVNTVTVTAWIGWDIIIERKGLGTLTKDVDFSWDKDTGQLLLLKPGEVFQPNEWFHVSFEPKVINGSTAATIINIEEIISYLLISSTVKQFSRGQLNARLWI